MRISRRLSKRRTKALIANASGRKSDVRLAQPHDRLLDLRFVGALDGAHELADPGGELAQAIHARIMPAR